MTTPQSSPTAPMYFVLIDSHGKKVPSTITTSFYSIIAKAVSGLKWIDNYNAKLSALALLSTPILDSHLSSAKALMLLIGTNSVRCTPTSTIITQVKSLINPLRSRHNHLLDKHCVIMVPCFPCFKSFYPLNTMRSLLDNIAQYNTLLFDLSLTLNFTIVDFHVMPHHIGVDRMHLDFKHNTLVKESIINHFEYLSSTLIMSAVKIIGRSREAKARRNKRRHLKLSLKQQQYYLTRPIDPPWSLTAIKKYLYRQKIKFAKISPIYRKTLRIQFNNQVNLQIAEAALPQDAFFQQSYS